MSLRLRRRRVTDAARVRRGSATTLLNGQYVSASINSIARAVAGGGGLADARRAAYREAAATTCMGLSARLSGVSAVGAARFSSCAVTSAPDIEHLPSKTAPS